MAVRARLNNTLRRLGSGWCLHFEARRRAADLYPESDILQPAAWLVEEERRALFDEAGAVFETDYMLALNWLPPSDEGDRLARWLFDHTDPSRRPARGALERFELEVGDLIDLIASALPEARRLDDDALLTFLHGAVSNRPHTIHAPETPAFLDVLLADEPLTGGVNPKLGERHLRTVSVRAFPSRPQLTTHRPPCLPPRLAASEIHINFDIEAKGSSGFAPASRGGWTTPATCRRRPRSARSSRPADR